VRDLLAKGADAIVFLNPSQNHDLVYGFPITSPEEVRIVPLGFDLSPFGECDKRRHKIRSRVLPRDDLFCLGMIGRLTAVKNIQLLLEAVGELKSHSEKGKGFCHEELL
jgi:glycosyltransferase involved in cell wall biosynthesis